MKTIWKFMVYPSLEIRIPKGAKVLSVQVQNEHPCIWFLLDTKEEPEARTFEVYGTGFNMPDNCNEYVGTYILQDLTVWHVFETTNLERK